MYAAGLLVARIVDGVGSYVHQDPLGSVRMVTQGVGGVVTESQYRPFGLQYGVVVEPIGYRLKFTGQQHDALTGLYYLYRRFYDPEIGRFLSPDPVLGHLTVPQSLDRYVYTINNPLRYIDPTGEDWWNPFSWVAAAVDAVGRAISSIGSAIIDALDIVMTVVGFIPGLDIISDAYFLGKALIDVATGKGSWADVAMNAAALLLPIGGSVFRVMKKAVNALDGASDAARTLNKADNVAGAGKAAAKLDNVGDSARQSRQLNVGGTGAKGDLPDAVNLNDMSGARPRPGTPNVVIGRGQQMPFKSGSFSEVRANQLPQNALAESIPEVHRVLQPGGKFSGITGSRIGSANLEGLLSGAGFRGISVWSDDAGRVLWQAFK